MKLPDKRLERVLEKFSDRIHHRQTLSMRKLTNSRKEEIQFGRFLGNQRVSLQALESVLYEQCSVSVADSQHLLLLEDSSQMAFSLQRQMEGLGKIDKGIVQGCYRVGGPIASRFDAVMPTTVPATACRPWNSGFAPGRTTG